MTFDARNQESNSRGPNSQGLRSRDQIPPSPERSASIHRHPKMMRGPHERWSRIKGQLVSDRAKGILAVEEIIASLHNSGQEPFPGFTENMTAEFASLREELGELDPNRLSNARRLVEIAKRVDFLSRTLSFVVGYSLLMAETNTSVASPSHSDTNPDPSISSGPGLDEMVAGVEKIFANLEGRLRGYGAGRRAQD